MPKHKFFLLKTKMKKETKPQLFQYTTDVTYFSASDSHTQVSKPTFYLEVTF